MICVTGAAGYLGSILVPKLIMAGHAVLTIDNYRYKQIHRNCIEGDIREQRILDNYIRECDLIIHLAALVGEPVCAINKEEAWDINFDCVRKICALKIPIIMPNTNSFYGSQPGICDEETPVKPLSVYAKSKLAGENYLMDSGVNAISLRLATVYGPSPRFRKDLLVNSFTGQMIAGPLGISSPYVKRNFISIEDVTDCFLFCIKNFDKLKNQIYNVGNDKENCTKQELALLINRIINQNRNYSSLIYTDDIYNDIDKRDYTVTSNKIYKAGFQCKYSIESEVPKIIEIFNGTFNKFNYEIASNV